ncbi:fimbrial biogenesis outer membrane usher protein [Providencia alcalifaciens]|uniref:fimbria/pilus outer membrane usher protein n=1 Tax=Providencia alcalifaciens TaxID=126385 RepID=UPI001CE17A5C|nr:fimbria/pilus outer membrane usher protein [Providencia alcalifaciens]UBX50598.1 fimbrial biogenesis outer membrane usher protein [Providencia alcalifaciens]
MKINNICLSLFIALGYIATSSAEPETYFDPEFLELPNKESVNLEQFERNEQLPGQYYVDIYINKSLIGSKNIRFFTNKNNELEPCLTLSDLKDVGVKVREYPELQIAGNQCINLSTIPDAKSEFEFGSQRLYLSIPQIALNMNPRGYVDLAAIDDGVNALLLNYSYNGSRNTDRKNDKNSSNSNYVNLRPGLNIGPWRLRNYTTWQSNDRQRNKWDTVYTYLSRNINAIKSQLILGDSTSPSNIFDSVPFRGVQLATDDDMNPESLRGYAPVVRGIARSNAQITIRQNGYTIYQTDVAAGPFEINDLYPTGGSGDLHVTIKEANGSEQYQIIPFASLPVLQREGYLSYSVTGGQYRSYDSNVDKKTFAQFALTYGLPWGITLFGGSQVSDKYQAYSIGSGQNLGRFGALSIDVTHASSTLSNGEKESGQSYRFRYNKNLNDIGTNIALAGYRYSTKGFYSLAEVFDGYRKETFTALYERRRNRGEITLSQSLGEGWGTLSVGFVSEDYWNSDRKTQSTTIGYNNSWHDISYGVNYSYNKNTNPNRYDGRNKDNDHQFAFTVSVPFSVFDSTFYYNLNGTNSSSNGSSGSMGISATQLDNRLNWSAQQNFSTRNSGTSGNLNASYRGQYGEVSGGTGYSTNNYNLYYGASGSVVAHSGGVVLGQQLGETVALVEIPDAANVPILNQTGIQTNGQGYALVPYITAYRSNGIQIDTSKLPDNTEMELTTQNVAPSRGAIVKASFNANVGYRAIMVITFADGKPVPFGAQAIFKDNGQLNGLVGNDGELYLSGLTESGHFIIQYNDKQQCQVDYNLTGVSNYMGLYKIKTICR